MKKHFTLVAVVLGLMVAVVIGGAEFLPTSVMADTTAQGCRQVEVPLDEGYGVSRSETRLECASR